MRTYINKENKHKIIVVPLSSTNQDGYIVINNGVVEWKEKKAFEDLYEEEPNYLEPVLDEKLAGIFDSLYVVNENIDKYKHKDTTLIYSTPTDEEIKLSEKELNKDLKKHDKNVGFYWPDSMSNEEIEKQLGVTCECKTLEKITKIKPKIVRIFPMVYKEAKRLGYGTINTFTDLNDNNILGYEVTYDNGNTEWITRTYISNTMLIEVLDYMFSLQDQLNIINESNINENIKPKITLTDKPALYKEALNYYNENCKGDFEAAVTPLLIYLAKEHHPMTKVIVESDKAELVEGIKSIVNNNFIID